MTPDQQEAFEERRAIMEYDGNLSRERAEELAMADVLGRPEQFDGAGIAH